jgi:hypothetical protein
LIRVLIKWFYSVALVVIESSKGELRNGYHIVVQFKSISNFDFPTRCHWVLDSVVVAPFRVLVYIELYNLT